MPDITFDDLMKVKTVSNPEASAINTDALMEYGKIALGILEQFNLAKGTPQLQSRQPQEQTPANVEMQKPTIDVGQIKEALSTIQSLKGDINISSLLKLLEENKEMVASMLQEYTK